MIRFFKEPLVHFLLLGAALFAASAFVSDPDVPRENEIVVSAGKIEHLAALFARTWQRPPTRAELDGLVMEYIREEAAYRESLAYGLDRDDTIIRRRLRQKLEFIAEDMAGRSEPSNDELAAYLSAHQQDFRIDEKLTFQQVYLSVQKRGDHLEGDARDILNFLNSDKTTDLGAVGDPIMLEPRYSDVSRSSVAGLFGPDFAQAVTTLEPGAWHGPIRSGYGFHLVQLEKLVQGRIPPLGEVRELVRREWENDRRKEAIETFYRDLLGRYKVSVQWPEVYAKEGGA
jgi:hypothetical protein